MEEEKEIQVTGSDSTEKHQNAPQLTSENKDDDECSFEISSIRLSDEQGNSPINDIEDAPKSPIVPPKSPSKPLDSPFRTRWVKGMQNPNRSFGSPNIQSPVTKYTQAAMEHTASELAKDFDAPEFPKEFETFDKSALDASAVTNSLLESSFTGPDSTNARLEAAYMWTKRENNSLLKKIKDLEEAAVAREQEKLEHMMTSYDSASPLKWAKQMMGETADSVSPKELDDKAETQPQPKLDLRMKPPPTQLYPSELSDLALPTLSPTTINTELRTNESCNFEESTETTNVDTKKSSSPFRRMVTLFLFATVCTILLSHRARVEIVVKEAMSKAAPILKEYEPLIDEVTKRVSEARDMVEAKLQPAKEFILPHLESAIVVCRHRYEHYGQVAAEEMEKIQILMGLKLDWDADILPMAQHYVGTQSDTPLEGMNVVVVRASTNVGTELVDIFSRLGARVMAVDGSVKYLASLHNKVSKVDTTKVDFSDLVSVANGAVNIDESFDHIDILINCVNSYSRDFGETKQGYEKHFGVNYLSEFLLTTKLLEPLAKSNGTLVHVESMLHALVDGSDLQLPKGENQPLVSIPGESNNLLAYSSALLASSLHHQYLLQTQKQVTVTSITSTPFIPAMSARAVLASVLGETDKLFTESVHSSLKLTKHKLGVWKDHLFGTGAFANPFEDQELLEDLMEWSVEAVSPYWWTKIEPKTLDLSKEMPPGSCLSEDLPSESEVYEYNAFYASSVATLLSVGSWSLLRQLMPSRYGDA